MSVQRIGWKAAGLAILAELVLGIAPLRAADRPSLVIMGEDSDPDSVARDSRVFRRVIDGLANQFTAAGFRVYDETAASLDGFVQGRTRRSDAEIIDIARRLTQPPVDIAVLFTLYASAEDKTYTKVLRSRLAGRLLDVKSGRDLGSLEVATDPGRPVPANCARPCLLEAAGDQARDLAPTWAPVSAPGLPPSPVRSQPIPASVPTGSSSAVSPRKTCATSRPIWQPSPAIAATAWSSRRSAAPNTGMTPPLSPSAWTAT
jgi:hypothetical protein